MACIARPQIAIAWLALAGCAIEIGDVEPCSVDAAALPQAGCDAGKLDCDCQAQNGCEIDARSDGNHCGACGRSCFGGACVEGRCQPLVIAQATNVAGIVVDDDHVYLRADGGILRVGKDGSEAAQVVADEDGLPFALDATHVYYGSDGYLRRIEKSGGLAPEDLASGQDASGIALDDASVYWTNLASGTVMRVDKEGGTPTQLGESLNALTEIALDDTHVFYLRGTGNGMVHRLDKAGGRPATLAGGEPEPANLQLDDTSVYWTVGETVNEARRVDKSGSFQAKVEMGGHAPLAIAVEPGAIYVATVAGDVLRLALDSGAIEILAMGQLAPRRIALGADGIYWANAGDDSVMRLAR